ncbi:hypothetical protein VNO77_09357 [Canavalia gladiata]|uniref:ADP-ribosyl cyclase/cyclic ADP-ribose hydrolase n=1 Tax=Canavalia gladiata TaxID=3824 RepID=A0AAN9M9T5_CANGL
MSSFSDHQWVHDVFINFRGEDSRKGIVSHLYTFLSNLGINTFLDDENLHKGMELKGELLGAIEGSRISVVVFSEHYADSAWCLMELVKIMECHRNNAQVVLPLFYGVDPSHVRHQKGAFGEALVKHSQKLLGKRMEFVLSNWRGALTEVANFSGWDVSKYRSEAEVVKEVVKEVLRILDDTLLSITDFPVGLGSRINEMIGFIENKSRKVCTVGIWGMGGSGKTTMAKAIYNQIHRKFVNKSFIENIREVCEKDSKGHIVLQKHLLSDVLKTKVKIHSIASGTTMIEKRLRKRKVLIVLDDVNKFEQLKALCGNLRWMRSGSVLIVTTRDVRLLNLLKVDHIFKMKEMDENESLELFSWHAFGKANPREDFSELTRNVVSYCGGLPLALEVIGSYLYERTKQEWESVLSKLERIPNDQVQEKLRISFDGLTEDNEKDIFLDICCFFIGKDRAYVTDILNGCGLHAEIGITILVERSLIKVERNNKLLMHDLLRDMGREIIRRSSPLEPEKRSRLWVNEDVLGVLTEHIGTKAIEGLALMLQRTSRVCFNTKAFEEMKRLRLLQFDHVQLAGDYEFLPKHLRWVYWQGFPLKYIPDNFNLENVVAIDMRHSNLKLVWKNSRLLESLKVLNLSHSRYLVGTPDFTNLPNLEKLILKDCQSLCEVHQSIGHLSNLLLINLKNCTSLTNLPKMIYKLKSLKTLIISGCSKIDKLEEDMVQMESLTTLIANNTGIKQVPFSIIRSKSIGYISLCGYEGLACDLFPSLIWSWMSPTNNIISCIQPSRSMSTSITSMDIQDNNLSDLLPMLSGFSKLRSICLQCGSEFQLTQELRKILDGLCDVNFTKLETTADASPISDTSMGSHLIGIGSYRQVINSLSKSISKGLTTNGSSNFILPGDNYPRWLAYVSEGHSVPFQVPGDSDCQMKGMALCVIYSSTLERMVAECLSSVLISNYTKCTIQIYKQDTTLSFNDEDWLGIISNLEPGDNVEIFVAFGHGMTVKRTAVYLIYDQSIAVKTETSSKENVQPSCNMTVEPSSVVKTDPSPNVKMESSPHVKLDPSPKPKENIYTRLTKRMGECLCLKQNKVFGEGGWASTILCIHKEFMWLLFVSNFSYGFNNHVKSTFLVTLDLIQEKYAHTVGRQTNRKLLLAKARKFSSSQKMSSFQHSHGTERPTRTTRP